MDHALIEEAARRAGIDPAPRLVDATSRFIDRVLEVNQSLNLTAIKEEAAIATRHLQDSWVPARFIPEGVSLIDVGTGAGFPGFALWLARPDLSLTLVDASGKRVAFLRELMDRFGFDEQENGAGSAALPRRERAQTVLMPDTDSAAGKTVALPGEDHAVVSCAGPMALPTDGRPSCPLPRAIHARAEDLGRDSAYRGQFDAAIARAVTALPVLAEFCLPLVKPGGCFIAMKGRDDETESARRAIRLLGGKLEEIFRYALPDTDVPRALVIIRKEHPTPPRFPRRMAAISRRAL